MPARTLLSPRPEFLLYTLKVLTQISLVTAGIWGWVTPCGGGCPVHCREPSSTPGLCPLDASLQMVPNVPRGRNHPWLRTEL